MSKKSRKSAIQFIIFVAVIIIIFFGMIFYSKYKVEKEEDKDKYHAFNFYFDSNQQIWFTQIQVGTVPYNIPFYYHPNELEDIIVEEGIEDIILRQRPQQIIISIPSDSKSEIALAGIEISKLTGERYGLLSIPTTSALSKETEEYPYATCEHANTETVVIKFERSRNNIIRSEGRCIILEFKDNESIRVADAFAYNLIKIM